MDIKAILNNIKTKGLIETLRMRSSNSFVGYKDKEEAYGDLSEKISSIPGFKDLADLSAKERKIVAAKAMLIVCESLRGYRAESEELKALIDEMDAAPDEPDDEIMKAWDGKMLAMENGSFKGILKQIYIKRLIPEHYDMKRGLPVKDIILFLQPRKGINPSFKYIYNKIKKETDHTAEFVSLYRGVVSTVEHFDNAVLFAEELAVSKALILHESSEYLGYIDVRPETKVIQLWHFCGAIKKIGFSTAGKPGYKSLAQMKEFPEYNKYDLVTMASPTQKPVFAEIMGTTVDDPVMQATGISRTDEFFDEEFRKKCYKKLYNRIPEAKEKKIILYAPTYRGLDPRRYAPDELDIPLLAKELGDEYVLIIKHHQTAKGLPEIPAEYKDSFAYDMTRGAGMTINELMTVSDICISDYSSLVFEFSLFERPIIFFMFDLEDYSGDRGMYLTYEEMAEGGAILKTNEEIVEYIKDIDNRFDKEKLLAFRDKYMSACDGHATERIINYIETGEITGEQK